MLYLDLILVLLIEDTIFYEVHSNNYMFAILNPSGFETINFVLLTKILVFYIQFSIIEIRIVKLETFFRVIFMI